MDIEVTREVDSRTPGEQLKSAREAANLSEEAVADHLKITVGYIRALETDDYDKLPDTPYVMGYMRAYTRLVRLDTEQFLAEFLRQTEGVGDDEDGSGKLPGRGNLLEAMSLKHWLALLVAVLLVWGLAVMLLGGSAESETAAPVSASDSALPAASLVLPVAANPPADGSVEAGTVETGTVEMPADTAATDAAAVSAETVNAPAGGASEEAEAPQGQMDTLAFRFTGECWLEITDANGDVLAADLLQDGDELVTEGKAPFSVMLGDVRMVSLSLNGKPFQLEPDGFRKTLRALVQ